MSQTKPRKMHLSKVTLRVLSFAHMGRAQGMVGNLPDIPIFRPPPARTEGPNTECQNSNCYC